MIGLPSRDFFDLQYLPSLRRD